jgi:hypothetical protein
MGAADPLAVETSGLLRLAVRNTWKCKDET